MSGKGLLELFQTEGGTYLDGRLKLGIRRVLDLQFKGIQPGFQLACCKCKNRKITDDCDPVFLTALMDTTCSPPVALARLWHNNSFLCKDCSPDVPSSNEDGMAAPKSLETAKSAWSIFSGPLSPMLAAALDGAGSHKTTHITVRAPSATVVKAAKPPLALSKPQRASFPGPAPSAALGLRSGPAAGRGSSGDTAFVGVAQQPAPSGKPTPEGSSSSAPVSERRRAAQGAGSGGATDGVADVFDADTAAEATDVGVVAAGEASAGAGPSTSTPCAMQHGSIALREYFEVRSSPMKGNMLSKASVEVTYTRNYLFGFQPGRRSGAGDDVDPASEGPGVLHLLSSPEEAAEVAKRYAMELSSADVQQLQSLDFSVPKPALQALSHTLLAIADWVLAPQALDFADVSGAAITAVTVAGTKSGSPETEVSAHAIAAQLRSWALTVHSNKDVQQHGTCLRPSLQCLGGHALGKPLTSLLELLNAPPLTFSLAREALLRRDRPQTSLASTRAPVLSPDRGAGFRLRPGWVLPLQRLAALLKKRNRRPDGPWRMSVSQLSVRLEELLQGDAIYSSQDDDHTLQQQQQLQQKSTGAGAGHAGSHAAAGGNAAPKLGAVDRFLRDLGATHLQVLEALRLADVDENVGFCVECGFVGALVACDSCVDSFCTNCLGQDPEDLADVWRCRFCQSVFQTEDTGIGAAGKAGPSAAGIMHTLVKQEPAGSNSRSETVDTIGTTTSSQEADEDEDEEVEIMEVQESPAAVAAGKSDAAGTSGAAVHGRKRPRRGGVEEQGHLQGSVAAAGQPREDARLMPAAGRGSGLQGASPAASPRGRRLGAGKEADAPHGLQKAGVHMETAAGVAKLKGRANTGGFRGAGTKRTRAMSNEGDGDDDLLVEPGEQSRKHHKSGNFIVVSEDEEMVEGGAAGEHGGARHGADDRANGEPSAGKVGTVDDDLLKEVAAAAVAAAARLRRAAGQDGADVADFRFVASEPNLGSELGHDGGAMHATGAGAKAARPDGVESTAAGVDAVASGDVDGTRESDEEDSALGEDSGTDSGAEAAPAAAVAEKPRPGQAPGHKRRDTDYEPSNEGGDEEEGEEEEDEEEGEGEEGEEEASSDPELGKAKTQQQQRQSREEKTAPTSTAAARRVAADPNGQESSEGTAADEDEDEAGGSGSGSDEDDSYVELVAEYMAPAGRRGRGRGRGNRGRGKKAARKRGRPAGRHPGSSDGGDNAKRGDAGFEASDDGGEDWVPPSRTVLRRRPRGGRPPRKFARPLRLPLEDGLGQPASSGMMDDRDAAAALMMLNTNSAAAAAGADGTAAAANAAVAAGVNPPPAPGVPQPAAAAAVRSHQPPPPSPLPGAAASSGAVKPGAAGATQAQALNPALAAGSNRADAALRSPAPGPSQAPQGAALISVVGTRTAAVPEPKLQDSRPQGQRHSKSLGPEQENQQQSPSPSPSPLTQQQQQQFAAGANAGVSAGQCPIRGSGQDMQTGVAVPQATAAFRDAFEEVKLDARAAVATFTVANPNKGLSIAKQPMTKKEATKAGCKLFEYAAERGVDAGLLAQWTATLARVLEWYETDLELQGTLKSCLNGLFLSSTADLDLSDLERMIRSITKMLDDSTQEAAATAATGAAVGPAT